MKENNIKINDNTLLHEHRHRYKDNNTPEG